MLARQLGTTQQVSFGTIVDAKREPGDIVRITRLGGIDEDHVIDSLTIPLTLLTAWLTGHDAGDQVFAQSDGSRLVRSLQQRLASLERHQVRYRQGNGRQPTRSRSRSRS